MEYVYGHTTSNQALSIQVSGIQSQQEKGFFRSKTSNYVQIVIQEHGMQYNITIKDRNCKQLAATVELIKENIRLSTLSNVGEVTGIIRRGIVGLDESKKAARLSKLFSKCLAKAGIQKKNNYKKSFKYLTDINKYKNIELSKKRQSDESKELKDLEKVIGELEKNPQSKKAWGKFYGKMELYKDDINFLIEDEEKIQILQGLLNKGILLARSCKTSYVHEEGINIEVTDQEGASIELANQMEVRFLDILKKLDQSKKN